jgi:hypothetical protein
MLKHVAWMLLAAVPMVVAGGEPRTSEELLRAGDQCARAGRLVEALEDWKRAYERCFLSFRESPFLFPVDAEYLDRTALKAKLLEEFQKEMPDDKILAQQKAMACLGYFGFDIKLKDTIIGLLTEQVAGFYDPDTKRLYLIREGEAREKPKWFDKLLGTGGPDAEEQKTVLVHEMSHALMDQYHDLLSIQRSIQDDDDMSLAVSGLIEGEATLCMMIGEVNGGDKSMLRSPPGFMSVYLNLLKPFLGFAGGSGFRKAPPILRESLLFPYFNGLAFCMSLTSREGSWRPVDAAFGDPPISTEQVLHPEKYHRDIPQRVEFLDIAGELGPEWEAVYSNVLGEFQIQVLLAGKLAAAEAEKAAAGWAGDFYRTYERKPAPGAPPGIPPEMVLAWASVWDSPGEAAEFREAMARFLSARRGADPQAGPPAGEEWSRTWRSDGRRTEVLSRGDTVWVLQDVPDGRFDAVRQKALQVSRAPKKLEVRRAHPEVEFAPERRLRTRRV